MTTRMVAALVAMGITTACTAPPAEPVELARPPQAGQPMVPARVASHMANLLNVLTLVVEQEPELEMLLTKVCEGELISEAELRAAGAIGSQNAGGVEIQKDDKQAEMF